MNAFTSPPTINWASLPQHKITTDPSMRKDGITLAPRNDPIVGALRTSQMERRTRQRREFGKK